MGDLWILRHGETEWSISGQHTGNTDIDLTANGERGAAQWAPVLAGCTFTAVVTSPLRRASHTAELAGVLATSVDEDLREWDYGQGEGRTTRELQGEIPGWDVWVNGPPGGETLKNLGNRVDRVLARTVEPLTRGDVLLVAHGHVLRVLAARWLREPPVLGSRLRLEPANIAILGHEHDRRVLLRWGITPAGL